MRIGHYAPDIWAPGGVSSYIRRVGRAQEARGDTVFYLGQGDPESEVPADRTPHHVEDDTALYHWAERAALDVLHVHKPLTLRPPDTLPVLRTLHDHSANCPSGTRYLANPGRPCNRVSSVSACTWGYLANACGSRRPHVIRRNVERYQREHETLRTLPMHAVSHHVKARMVADGYEADRIHVLHSPAPTSSQLYTPPPRGGEPRFLFVGRIVPEKGLAPLLRALAQVDVPVHLDVAGEGHQQEGMELLSRRLGLSDRVTFHGWVDPARVRTLMESARAIVFPSLWNEPAGLITLEAAAAGRAVIASRAGGIPEYATEDYAILVPPGGTAALASALTRLATDYEEAARLGQRGRQIVAETFDMKTFLSGLDTIYETVRTTAPLAPTI